MINKLKFKGTTLYRKTVTDNIIKVYNDSRMNVDGDWYKDANDFASKLGSTYNLSTETVCAIIASLSPLKSWSENKRITELFLRDGSELHTGAMMQKAKDILSYKDTNQTEFFLYCLRGNKIQSFFINMAFVDLNFAVTIDRHALSICLGRSAKDKEGTGITDNQYDFFVSCFVQAAIELGVRSSMVQSVTWEKWRVLKKIDKI